MTSEQEAQAEELAMQYAVIVMKPLPTPADMLPSLTIWIKLVKLCGYSPAEAIVDRAKQTLKMIG